MEQPRKPQWEWGEPRQNGLRGPSRGRGEQQPFAGAKGGGSRWDSSCLGMSRARVRLVRRLSEQETGGLWARRIWFCWGRWGSCCSPADPHCCEKHRPGGWGTLALFPTAGTGEQSWQRWKMGSQPLLESHRPSFPWPPAWSRGVCSQAAPYACSRSPFVGCEHPAFPSGGVKWMDASQRGEGGWERGCKLRRAGRQGGKGRGAAKSGRSCPAYVERGERTFPPPELEPLQSIWELGRLPTDILHL